MWGNRGPLHLFSRFDRMFDELFNHPTLHVEEVAYEQPDGREQYARGDSPRVEEPDDEPEDNSGAAQPQQITGPITTSYSRSTTWSGSGASFSSSHTVMRSSSANGGMMEREDAYYNSRTGEQGRSQARRLGQQGRAKRWTRGAAGQQNEREFFHNLQQGSAEAQAFDGMWHDNAERHLPKFGRPLALQGPPNLMPLAPTFFNPFSRSHVAQPDPAFFNPLSRSHSRGRRIHIA